MRWSNPKTNLCLVKYAGNFKATYFKYSAIVTTKINWIGTFLSLLQVIQCIQYILIKQFTLNEIFYAAYSSVDKDKAFAGRKSWTDQKKKIRQDNVF